MKQTGKRALILLLLLIILTLVFIWGNSSLPSNKSYILSDTVTEAVGGEITANDEEEMNADNWLTSKHVRKLAHATEYAVLAVEIVLLMIVSRRRITEHISTIMLAGLSVALIDETIQLFNDRTSMVEDIWIDLSGFLIGALLTWFVYTLIKRRKM